MAGKNKNHIGDNPETTELYDAVSNVGVLRALSLGEWDKWRDCKLGSGTGGGVTIDDVNDLIQQAIEELPAAQDWTLDINTGDATTLDASKAYTDEAIKYIPMYDWGTDIKQGDMDTLMNANSYAEQSLRNSEMTQYSIILHDTKTYTDSQLDVAKEYTDSEIAKLPAGIDWQAAIDLGDKNTKQAAEQYTDNQSMWILTEAGNQISNGLASASIYTDQEIVKARKYTDDEIAAAAIDYNLVASQTLSTSKSYTDVKFKEATKYAEDCAEGASFDSYTYTDNRFANIPLMTPNAISDSIAKRSSIGTLAASPAQTDADLTTLGQVKTRELDVLNASKTHANNAAGQAWTDSKDYTNQELGNQMNYINSGDSMTLASANSYTDSKIVPQKDWQSDIDSGDAKVKEYINTSLTLLGGVVESKFSSTTIAHRTGNLTTPDTNTSNVILVANNPGGNRTTQKLPVVSSVPDGYYTQVYNCCGGPISSEFSSSVRVHLPPEDYEKGYRMQGPKETSANSVLVLPFGFVTLILDNTRKVWFYSGTLIEPNDSKVSSTSSDTK